MRFRLSHACAKPPHVLDSLKDARGPILLEIDKPAGAELGVLLAMTERYESQRRTLFVQSIVQGSIADR